MARNIPAEPFGIVATGAADFELQDGHRRVARTYGLSLDMARVLSEAGPMYHTINRFLGAWGDDNGENISFDELSRALDDMREVFARINGEAER
jgi:hypothetical protein